LEVKHSPPGSSENLVKSYNLGIESLEFQKNNGGSIMVDHFPLWWL